MSPDTPYLRVIATLDGRERGDGQFQAFCPSHADRRPSLSVTEAEDGKVLICCHAGCQTENVLKELGLTYEDLAPPRPPATNHSANSSGPSTCAAGEVVYTYEDQDGRYLFEVVRLPGKRFLQRRQTEHGLVLGLKEGRYLSKDGQTWYQAKKTRSPDSRSVTRNFPEVRLVPYRLPQVRSAVDRGAQVFFVEGEKDADRLSNMGLIATCSPGGANRWREEHAQYFEGANVVLLPDNDDVGRRHMHEVAHSLHRVRAAQRMLELPHLPDKGDVSDWLDAGGSLEELQALAESAPPFSPDQVVILATPERGNDSKTVGQFFANPQGFFLIQKEGGLKQLSNFTATIVRHVQTADLRENEVFYDVSARVGTKQIDARVRAREFGSMAWVAECLGPEAIIFPGYTVKDSVRAAIQLFSESIEGYVVYRHLGWTKINDTSVFVFRGGGIGPGGVLALETELDAQLNFYELELPTKADLAAIRASLDLLDLAPDAITFPLLAAVYRAPLGRLDFILHVFGRTGVFKTELATLFQQHYGPQMTSRNLPGSWSSTANALEGLLSQAKDVMVVVDDFAPGHGDSVARAHQSADRVVRAVGNQSGRQRMTRDARLRAPAAPRALVVSTGEDVPRGHSLRARMAVIEVCKGDVNEDRLTDAQKLAAAGTYNRALAGYIRHLASSAHRVHPDEVRSIRDELAQMGGHRRTPDLAANLAVGFERFCAYALEVGVISEDEREALTKRARTAFTEMVALQALQQGGEDPAYRFIELLTAVLTSGKGHLEPVPGQNLENLSLFGWAHDGLSPHPRGVRLGWVDGDDVYLIPEAAFGAVQTLGRETDGPLTVTQATLTRRLSEAGILESRETNRRANTVRRTIDKNRVTVLHLRAETLGLKPVSIEQEFDLASTI